MKICYILSVLCFTGVLNTALASNSNRSKIDKVQSEVLSYANQKMKSLPMMRGNSASLQCYDKFIPSINALALEARDNSKTCVNNANGRKNIELEILKNHKTGVAEQVAKITDSLQNCSKRIGFEYFICFKANADVNMDMMHKIKLISEGIGLEHNRKIAEIEKDERSCLNNAVDEAKSKTDKVFDDLRKCVKNEAE